MLLNRRSAPISGACVQSTPVTREPDPVVPFGPLLRDKRLQPLAVLLVVARTWLSIRFELVSGPPRREVSERLAGVLGAGEYVEGDELGAL